MRPDVLTNQPPSVDQCVQHIVHIHIRYDYPTSDTVPEDLVSLDRSIGCKLALDEWNSNEDALPSEYHVDA